MILDNPDDIVFKSHQKTITETFYILDNFKKYHYSLMTGAQIFDKIRNLLYPTFC